MVQLDVSERLFHDGVRWLQPLFVVNFSRMFQFRVSGIDFLCTVCWQRPLETRIAKKQTSSFSSIKRHLSVHDEMFELN